jgi:hypothetical protein
MVRPIGNLLASVHVELALWKMCWVIPTGPVLETQILRTIFIRLICQSNEILFRMQVRLALNALIKRSADDCQF